MTEHFDFDHIHRHGNPIQGIEIMATTDSSLVCGTQIQIDRSGVGHNWRNIDADDIPANVREEIECEILDGGKDDCERYVASNGQHYRW